MARRKLDAYMTDEKLVFHLFKHVEISGNVLEPCAGDGAIVNMLNKHPEVGMVFPNDIDPNRGWEWTYDATQMHSPLWNNAKKAYKWLITNPPWDNADLILDNAHFHGIENVALLLRLSFEEPTSGNRRYRGRKDLLDTVWPYLTEKIVFGSPRPSFTDDGRTDSVTCGWFVFDFTSKPYDGCKCYLVPNWDEVDLSIGSIVFGAK